MKFVAVILAVAFAAQKPSNSKQASKLPYCKAPKKDGLGSLCAKISQMTTARYLNAACEGFIGERSCQTTCCKVYSGTGPKKSKHTSRWSKHSKNGGSRWSRYTRHGSSRTHGNPNGNQKGFWRNQYDHDRQSRGNQRSSRYGRGGYSHGHSMRHHYAGEDGQTKGKDSEYGRGSSRYSNAHNRWSRYQHGRGSRGTTSHGRYSRHGSSSHGRGSSSRYSRHGSSGRGYSRHGSSRHGSSGRGYSRGGRGYSRGGRGQEQEGQRGYSHGH